LLADGIGVIIASRILKCPLPQRVTGFEFVSRLLESGRSFYLYGSKPGVADAAAENLRAKGVNVVGARHGYFDDDSEVINDINEKKPNILLVCLGAPKQEKWIAANKHRLNVNLCTGVGSTLDIMAGNVRRAPTFIQKWGIEWLYRAIVQPSRIPRLAAIPRFLLGVRRESSRRKKAEKIRQNSII